MDEIAWVRTSDNSFRADLPDGPVDAELEGNWLTRHIISRRRWTLTQGHRVWRLSQVSRQTLEIDPPEPKMGRRWDAYESFGGRGGRICLGSTPAIDWTGWGSEMVLRWWFDESEILKAGNAWKDKDIECGVEMLIFPVCLDRLQEYLPLIVAFPLVLMPGIPPPRIEKWR